LKNRYPLISSNDLILLIDDNNVKVSIGIQRPLQVFLPLALDFSRIAKIKFQVSYSPFDDLNGFPMLSHGVFPLGLSAEWAKKEPPPSSPKQITYIVFD
jgi:hypothetical protein